MEGAFRSFNISTVAHDGSATSCHFLPFPKALEAALPAVSSPTCREEPRLAVRQVDRKQPDRGFLMTLGVRREDEDHRYEHRWDNRGDTGDVYILGRRCEEVMSHCSWGWCHIKDLWWQCRLRGQRSDWGDSTTHLYTLQVNIKHLLWVWVWNLEAVKQAETSLNSQCEPVWTRLKTWCTHTVGTPASLLLDVSVCILRTNSVSPWFL